MFASSKLRFVPHSFPFRWAARASAAVLGAIWLTMFANEVSRHRLNVSAINTYVQAACLAIVFAGYAVGWRRELAGGITVIIGTLAFFVLVLTATDELPGVAVLLFALPGVLYLLAWHYDERRRLRL